MPSLRHGSRGLPGGTEAAAHRRDTARLLSDTGTGLPAPKEPWRPCGRALREGWARLKSNVSFQLLEAEQRRLPGSSRG